MILISTEKKRVKNTIGDEKATAFAEAISVLSGLVNTDGRDWSARPHLVQTCQAKNGEYRCVYDIFKDLATIWDGICSMERLRSDIEALRRENDNEADS